MTCPDRVNFNGACARLTVLSEKSVPQHKLKEFDGSVDWVGVTCNTTYEVTSGGPFVHRRVLFKSPILWPGSTIVPSADNPGGGLLPGEYSRAVAGSLSEASVNGVLRKLFTTPTVRGCVQGPTRTVAVSVLKDETFNMTGKEDGVRRFKKYWNSLKGEPTMRYKLSTSDGFTNELSEPSQHIYLLDFFSYGLEGLDRSLPPGRTESKGVQSGMSGSDGPPIKKQRSGDSDMSGTSGSFGVESIAESLPTIGDGDAEDGVASVVTEMKVYFKSHR